MKLFSDRTPGTSRQSGDGAPAMVGTALALVAALALPTAAAAAPVPGGPEPTASIGLPVIRKPPARLPARLFSAPGDRRWLKGQRIPAGYRLVGRRVTLAERDQVDVHFDCHSRRVTALGFSDHFRFSFQPVRSDLLFYPGRRRAVINVFWNQYASPTYATSATVYVLCRPR